MSYKSELTRRDFLKLTGLVAAGTTLAACAPALRSSAALLFTALKRMTSWTKSTCWMRP
jgi:anaerobic selenocysteine-containing dehydrogenase